MSQVTIKINSREYPIACEDGQEKRIWELAEYLDKKAKALEGSCQVNENLMLAMLSLLVADELFESKKKGGKKDEAEPQNAECNAQIAQFDASFAEKIANLANDINSIATNLKAL